MVPDSSSISTVKLVVILILYTSIHSKSIVHQIFGWHRAMRQVDHLGSEMLSLFHTGAGGKVLYRAQCTGDEDTQRPADLGQRRDSLRHRFEIVLKNKYLSALQRAHVCFLRVFWTRERRIEKLSLHSLDKSFGFRLWNGVTWSHRARNGLQRSLWGVIGSNGPISFLWEATWWEIPQILEPRSFHVSSPFLPCDD